MDLAEGLRLSEDHLPLRIPEVVSLSEDARTLYVRIAVEKAVGRDRIVYHHLAKVDMEEQHVTLLSRLLDIRF